MPLAPDLLGAESDPVEFRWTHDDTMLYALAIGAGQDDPGDELRYTTENSEGVAPAVLPTYANIVTRGARPELGDVDRTRLVHAEQAFTLAGPLPVAGRSVTTARVTEVLDKGSGALVTSEAVATDAASGATLATTRQTIFLGGEGGFGGPRGESAPSPIPDRDPDDVVEYATRPEQALVYRLTGDRNPLHSDPAFAARGGFDRPILHGMCTYGFTFRALLRTACEGDPARVRGMAARFTRPVLPGDRLTVHVWRDGDRAYFRTLRDADVVLDRGVLELA